MFAPLIIVFAFAGMINRMSAATAQLVFYSFAAVMGLSISWIFAVFTGVSIAQTFFVTAVAFAGLSLYGYTTKKDLSGLGTFLMMGVIGLIVAMVINIFLQSPAMMFAISIIGVLIFAALTAYDTQAIKNEYVAHAAQGDQEWLQKSAIMGALRLGRLGSCRECGGNCRAAGSGHVTMAPVRPRGQGTSARAAEKEFPSRQPSASGSALTPRAPRAASARSRRRAARCGS